MKKILVVLGHPNVKSFNSALFSEYVKGAKESGGDVKTLVLAELKFDPIYHGQSDQALEPDLLHAQELIKWAEHIVFFYPTWWCTMPALMKGFFDRTFVPNFAYDFVKGKATQVKLLKGRTARLIVTMDEPPFYYYLAYWAAGHIIMKRGVLGFCGIKTSGITTIGPVTTTTPEKRVKYLLKVFELGKSLK